MKLHQLLENEQQIKQALDEMLIEGDYEITSNGVDVDGSVKIQMVTEIPVQFNIVTGIFDCTFTDITSLKGAPREVGSHFECSETKIRSLQEGPREVGGNFNCSNTNITSLKGAPMEVGGDFACIGTKIKGKPDASHIDIGGRLIWKVK